MNREATESAISHICEDKEAGEAQIKIGRGIIIIEKEGSSLGRTVYPYL